MFHHNMIKTLGTAALALILSAGASVVLRN